MERDLHARDRVGVQDFVLLENFQSVDAFVDNLRKRFKENLIYVSRQYFGMSLDFMSQQEKLGCIVGLHWTDNWQCATACSTGVLFQRTEHRTSQQ